MHSSRGVDPLADKLLLMSAFICLAVTPNLPGHLKLPPYVPIIVISRDAMIVLGSVMIHIITGDVNIRPSIAGKITTFFQMMTIVSVLLQLRWAYAVWAIAVLLTVISGVDYIIKGSRLLGENHVTAKRVP